MIHEIQSERHAQKNASDGRKIKAAVFALVGDVSGQAPQPERKFRSGEQERAGNNQHHTEDQQHFAEIVEWAAPSMPRCPRRHRFDLSPAQWECKR